MTDVTEESSAAAVPSPTEEREIVFDPAYAFDMPVIAQTSLSSIFDFTFDVVDPVTIEDNIAISSGLQMPYVSSTSSSPTLPSSSAAPSISGSGSSAYESGPLTPELVSADSGSGSSNSASVAYGSPTWSYDLFGGEASGVPADGGFDGPLGVDMEDLFGDGLDLGGGGSDGLDIGSGIVGFDVGGDHPDLPLPLPLMPMQAGGAVVLGLGLGLGLNSNSNSVRTALR